MSSLNSKNGLDDETEKCSLTMANEMEYPNDGKVIIKTPASNGKKNKSPIILNMELLKNLDEKPGDLADSESGPSITSRTKNIKHLNLGYTNLTYTVKTLLTRGEF